MKVKDIMSKDVIVAEVPGSREHVIELMDKHGKMGLPVVKKGTKTLVGMVTKSDLLSKADEQQLAMLMTRDPITVNPDDDVKEAALKIINHGVRRLPVVENDELVGIITVSDIITSAIRKLDPEEGISDLFEKNVFVLWEKTPVSLCLYILRFAGLNAAPVINDSGQLVGFISTSDFIKMIDLSTEALSNYATVAPETSWSWDKTDVYYITKKIITLPDKLLEEVMVKNVVTVTIFTSLVDVIKKMRKYDVDQIPVLDAGDNLVGLISDLKILRHIVNIL